MAPVFGLTEQQAIDLGRAADAARRAAGSLFETSDPAVIEQLFQAANRGDFLLGDRSFQFVEITGAISGGFYPGYWNSTEDGTQVNQSVVKVKSASGQALVEDRYYLALFSHYDDGVSVFIVPDAPPSSPDFLWLKKSADYNPAVGEAVTFDVTGGNCQASLPAGAAVNDKVILCPLYTAGSNRVILSGTLADTSNFYLNGGPASGNNLGTGYASGEGNYLFRYVGIITVSGTDYPHWTCDRPLN